MTGVHPMLRKALALTLLAAVLSTVWLGLFRPLYRQYQTYGESITHSATLLERYGRIGATADRVAELLRQVKAEGNRSRGILGGQSVELAGAEMQERLKRIVESSGGQLNSSQVLAVEEKDAARRLGIRVAMTADIDAFQRALYDFETAEPYFFVDNLNVQAPRMSLREARGRRTRSNVNPAEMQIRFDVYGFLKAAE
jgi:general secretion pathway protein M